MKSFFTLLFLLSAPHIFAQQAGMLDPTFGTGGKVVTTINNIEEKATGVVIQPDNKIVVCGYTFNANTAKDFVCIRYKYDGTLDSTFGVNGMTITDIDNFSNDIANCITLQADGKIVVAGNSDNGVKTDGVLVRYKTDGSLDSTFGINGIIILDFGNNMYDQFQAIQFHPQSNKIILAGYSNLVVNNNKLYMFRYLLDGNLDTTFNTTGVKYISGGNHMVENFAMEPNGKITGVGWHVLGNRQNYVFRLHNNGTFDSTFFNIGLANILGVTAYEEGFDIELLPNGHLLLAGHVGYMLYSSANFLLHDVTVNNTNPTTLVNADINNNNMWDVAYVLEKDNTGRHVMGGATGDANNKTFAVLRTTINNAVDGTFGTSGYSTVTFGNPVNECLDMKIFSNNKIICVGYTGNNIALARILAEDTTNLEAFQLTSPANNYINNPYSMATLNWTKATGATSYEIQLDTNINFSTPQINNVNVLFTMYTNLTPSKDYYWRVRATDGVNIGQWTAAWKFTTKALDNTSVYDFNLKTFSITPNPFDNNFVLHQNKTIIDCHYKISDIFGKTIKLGKVFSNDFLISLENVSSGIYLLQVGQNLEFNYKIIKR